MKKLVWIFTLFIFAITNAFGYEKSAITSNMGYVGTLPDLSSYYRNDNPERTVKTEVPAKDFNSESGLKPVPRDNPTFVNIVLKSDKTSQYVNDLNEFIPMLEAISEMIDNKSSVQVFNAKVYFFNKNVEYFRDKYLNKQESMYASYKKLMDVSMQAKSIALLRNEAIKYNPYLAYGGSGYIYNPNNVTEQLNYLNEEIKQTILLLRESN